MRGRPWLVRLPALLLALAPARASAQAASPVLSAALALAQEGRIDSARTVLRQLEATTAPTDSLFPGILYSSALIAKDATETRTRLQRVVAEYPVSPWAGESIIRLAQLDYAQGDPAAAARQLEKFRTDHAASPLYPVAAVWGARAAFDSKDATGACRWVTEGLGRNPSEAARTELAALSRKCGPGPAAPSPDTIKPQAAATPPVAQPAATTQPVQQPPPPGPSSITPAASSAYRVQVAAAASSGAAAQILERARGAGFDGIVVEDGGYHKVRLGSYATRSEAAAALPKIRARLGGAPFVVNP